MELKQIKIGATIAALRKSRGLTQEQLADMLGVSAPAVSKWETDSSYPDITLLCPLARALGVHVDDLLQFEETLSDQEVVAQINAIVDTALHKSCEEAETQLQALLHRYPSCTALQFNAAVAYDTFQAFSPAAHSQWKSRKKALLEQVRATGSSAYWQSATIQLATMAMADDELEQGAALLRELPEYIGDPTAVWSLYYIKKDQPEEALKLTQKQLYKLANQIQSCLISLINPKLTSQPRKILKICSVYRAIAQAFGLTDLSDGPLMQAYVQLGEIEKAAHCFARYVDIALGPVTYPDEELFSPGLPFQKQSGVQATTKPMRQMMVQAIQENDQYKPLFKNAVFAAAMEKLKASL